MNRQFSKDAIQTPEESPEVVNSSHLVFLLTGLTSSPPAAWEGLVFAEGCVFFLPATPRLGGPSQDKVAVRAQLEAAALLFPGPGLLICMWGWHLPPPWFTLPSHTISFLSSKYSSKPLKIYDPLMIVFTIFHY